MHARLPFNVEPEFRQHATRIVGDPQRAGLAAALHCAKSHRLRCAPLTRKSVGSGWRKRGGCGEHLDPAFDTYPFETITEFLAAIVAQLSGERAER